MGHFVYKYVYDGEIIYIGKTDNMERRVNQHGAKGDNIADEYHGMINNSEIYYCTLPNEVMSDVVESELIRRYKPRLNKAKMSEWGGLEFAEPKWELYKKPEKKPIKKREKFDTKTMMETAQLWQVLREIAPIVENHKPFSSDDTPLTALLEMLIPIKREIDRRMKIEYDL